MSKLHKGLTHTQDVFGCERIEVSTVSIKLLWEPLNLQNQWTGSHIDCITYINVHDYGICIWKYTQRGSQVCAIKIMAHIKIKDIKTNFNQGNILRYLTCFKSTYVCRYLSWFRLCRNWDSLPVPNSLIIILKHDHLEKRVPSSETSTFLESLEHFHFPQTLKT